ncbi:hypothetical protein EQJ95_02085 [Pediococcus acidilactici]|jgi:hypothetical protein|uniref:Gp15 family bacteriophage protein n=1 Tax=Pediococcus acidilactici TaxID=1254 RepID=UPI000FF8BFBF|nr:Gp15 family bacteriophage protein [Pediococcus acidilactici]QAR86309.1 hypothetical protein EQJ95_02085 [Pediococcus acidilactici]
MLSLTDRLESTLRTEAGELPVNLAFNTVLDWYKVSENEDFSIMQKVKIGWQLFFNGQKLEFDSENDYEIAAKALGDLSDYINQDPYNDPDDYQAEQKSSPSNKLFSYTQDAEAIYASFIFDYNIDLLDEMDKMRWEKFRALFNNLSPKSPFKRIIEIRQRSTKGLEGEELASLQEAQNYYALKGQSTSSVDEAIGSMFNMLMTQIKQGQ